MLQRLFIALFILFFSNLTVYSQNIFVPYRVGDKFGIANEKGEMKIKPAYDFVRVCDMNNYFTCYKTTGDSYTSSLIYKDKVIIKDQQYFSYYPYNDIVVAVSHTDIKTGSFYTFGNELSHIYNNKGERILPGDYEYVDVLTDFDPKNESNEVLIDAYDLDEKYSVYVFDKKLNKVKQQLLDKIEVDEIDANSVHWDKEMFIRTKAKGKNPILYTIKLTDKGYELTQEEIQPRSQRDDMFWGDDVAVPDFGEERMPAVASITQEEFMQQIDKRHDHDAFQKPDMLKFKSEKLDATYQCLIKQNGKTGLKLVREDNVILAAKYDEIYKSEFAGHNYTGYVMRNDGKYGLYIYPFGGPASIIEPVYTMMPWLEEFNYGKEGFHLISLYDEKGNLHHYANQQGKEYYRVK